VLAVQGPRAKERLAGVFPEAAAVGRFRVAELTWRGVPCVVAGTGYTGEDGFELFLDVERAGEAWDAVLEAGRPLGLVPVGLGARDTLRLEAGMPLYGNELDRTTTPYEAGLDRVV
jgi:aminomethyltransferase